MMSQNILVGVGANLSLPTRAALEQVCCFLREVSWTYHLILLHVIPVPLDPTLILFTPTSVARRYTPTGQIGPGEIEAAARALKRLAKRGLLLCQEVQGEMRCWND